MNIPKNPLDSELTEIVVFDSRGHYPNRIIKLSKEELTYIEFLDNKSVLYNELSNEEIGLWFHDRIMKEERRKVRMPSFTYYC